MFPSGKRLVSRLVSRFAANVAGSTVVVFALAVPGVLIAGAAAMDFSFLANQRSALQAAADTAALGSAKELTLANRSASEIAAIAENFVSVNGDLRVGIGGTAEIRVKTSVSIEDGSVTVQLSQVWSPLFVHLVSWQANPIVVSATAQVFGSSSLCIVGLMDYSIFASVHLDNNARIDAGGCSVHSNSTSKFSIRMDGMSRMTAESVCAAGGVLSLGSDTISPSAVTDCPQLPGPLADRPAPDYGACNAKSLVVDTDRTLSPGVYCAGLTITNGAQVRFSPGVFVIKDGPFVVDGAAGIAGIDVGFYFTGADSVFDFRSDTHVDLEAPRDGPLAGILFFEDRDVPHSFDINALVPEKQPPGVRMHRIASNDARKLLGTIYLSKSVLMVDADAPVADRSAYTALVVARLWLREGPTLYLNTDFAATEVPLPDAMAGGEIGLVR